MELIPRNEYLNRLIKVKHTPEIKVITGVRRAGKSKLLELFKMHLKKDINNNVISVDFNNPESEKIIKENNLFDHIEKQYDQNKSNFVLLDEVQNYPNFEQTLIYLQSTNKYHLYVTGSNAFLLSSQLVTLFTGRTFPIQVFPFSFKEFIEYENVYNLTQKIELNNSDNPYNFLYTSLFDKYLENGGFSGSYIYTDQIDKDTYLNNLVLGLILRDVKTRNKLRNENVLDKLVEFLFSNNSCLLSSRNITNYLKQEHPTLSHKTIISYLKYLTDAFVFYKIPRFDIKGKAILLNSEKYYCVDHRLKYSINTSSKNIDLGRDLENIVFLELLRRNYKVYTGNLYKTEIDFVALNTYKNEKIYIQVCNSISDKHVFDREVNPLLKIKDNFKKLIITRSYQPRQKHEGIEIVDITEFLLNKEI